MNYLNLYTAKQKMRLKNSNACLSFVSTVWNGEVVLCVFNNIRFELDDVFSRQALTKSDVDALNKITAEFLGADNETMDKNKRKTI